MRDMAEKVALVTGATSGIGFEIAAGLAQMHALVFVHGRTEEGAASAVSAITKRVPDARLVPVAADLASLAAVDALAQSVLDAAPHFNILMMNAGVMPDQRRTSADGYELQLAVNVLANVGLARRLLPRMQASAPSRIVAVSSISHAQGRIDFDDLHFERRPYGELAAYAQSKLGLMLVVNAMARQIEGSGVTMNALHPGAVRSRIGRGHSFADWFLRLIQPFLLSPFEGAKTPLYVATERSLRGVNGRYFVRCREAASSRLAQDQALADRFWAVANELCDAVIGTAA